MSSSITCPTKILTLEIVSFLFILVGVLCKFTMVPGLYIFPQAKEVHCSSRGHRVTHSAAHYITMTMFLMNWKKHKQGIQLCYGVYNETK